MTKDTYDESDIKVLHGLEERERDTVTVLCSDDMPEELWKTAEKIIEDHKDLWFVEIRGKNGGEIMAFRCPHP